MSTHLPGPSSLPRLTLCMGSELLPHADTVSEPAAEGSVLHRFLAEADEHGAAVALGRVPEEHRARAAAIDFDQLPARHSGAAEVSFAWRPSDGRVRELGRNLTREQVRAAAEPDELVGTADWAGLSNGGKTLVVLDWKTGRSQIDPAAQNWQVLTYAVALARLWECEDAVAGIVRLGEDGQPYYDTVPLDALDLAAHEGALLTLLERRADAIALHDATGELPKLVVGEHCRFCPSARFCPAQAGLVHGALTGQGALARAATAELTPALVAEVWPQLQATKARLKLLEETLELFVHQRPVPLANGLVLAAVEVETTSVAPERAAPLLAQRFGQAFVEAATKPPPPPTMPKERIKDALRELVVPRLKEEAAGGRLEKKRATLAAAERELYAALESAGAMTRSTYVRVREVKRAQDEGEVVDAAPPAPGLPAPPPEAPTPEISQSGNPPPSARERRTQLPGERTDLTCPDCGSGMYLHATGDRVRIYFCDQRPLCDANHGAHSDGSPHGVPADRATREARSRAHQAFDLLWTRSHMSREEAYAWLGRALALSEEEAHIGLFDASTCEHVVALATAELARLEALPPPKVGADGQLLAPF